MFKTLLRRKPAHIVYPITDAVALQLELDTLRVHHADNPLMQLHFDRMQSSMEVSMYRNV